MTKMTTKGSELTGLSVAIAAALSMAGSIAPLGGAQAKSLTIRTASPNAIIGTGATSNAIIGTGATSKPAKSNAIIGTGATGNAIIGTGATANAIIGTGATGNAIIGTGADAIIGTGSQKIVAAKGPVDSADAKTGTVVVMGRTLAVGKNSTTYAAIQTALASGKSVQLRIEATLKHDGSLNGARLGFDSTDYIAGVTDVVASGRVTKLNSSTGKATVGGAVIDYTSLLATQPVNLKVGDVIAVVGSRPERSSAILVRGIAFVGN